MADHVLALLDTPVLFPAALRDTLLRVARLYLFEPKWSAETLDDLARNLVRTGRMTEEAFDRLLASLLAFFPAATVVDYSGFQTIVTNHPKDRHVLAAAIASKADVIVIPNLRDFGSDALSPYDIRAISPDDFLLELLDRNAEKVQTVIDLQWRELRRPPMSREQVLDSLAKVVPRFAQAMREHPT